MSEPGRLLDDGLLDALDAALDRCAASVNLRWAPGSEAAEVEQSLQQKPLNDELAIWWGRHDGVSGLGAAARLGGWSPLSASEAARATHQVQRAGARILEHDSQAVWQTGWIVVFADAGPRRVACDCSGPPDAPTPVHLFDPMFNDDPLRPHLPSLGELIALWIDVIDAGLWQTDDSGTFIYRGMAIYDEFAQHFPDRDPRLAELIAC